MGGGARIDTAAEDSLDVLCMLFPLRPVVVFDASNFPLTFSTAGGDAASALTAGMQQVVERLNGQLTLTFMGQPTWLHTKNYIAAAGRKRDA